MTTQKEEKIQFEIGDVVRLKSGGPEMTVEDIDRKLYGDKDGAWCTWFNAEGKKVKDWFDPATLDVVPS